MNFQGTAKENLRKVKAIKEKDKPKKLKREEKEARRAAKISKNNL